MATIAVLTSTETGAASLSDINVNFAALNTQLISGTDPGHLHTVASISATGTPSNATFLRGDGVWASPIASVMTTLGDLTYGGASGVATRLPGDVTNSRVFLIEQASGSVATAPVWGGLVTADLPLATVAKGGTGLVTLTAHSIVIGNATSSPTLLAPGTLGQVLTSNGASADPSYQAVNLLLSSTTPVSLSNTATLTTLATVTIPGNTMGTANVIRGRFFISQFQDTSGIGATLTITLIYGTTTVATLAVATPASSWSPGSQQGFLDFLLIEGGTTSAQSGSLYGSVGGGINTGTNLKAWTDAATGTGTVDATSSQTLAVKAQWSAASAGRVFTINHFVIDLIH